MKEKLDSSLKAYYNGHLSHDYLMDCVDDICSQKMFNAFLMGVVIGGLVSIGICLYFLSI